MKATALGLGFIENSDDEFEGFYKTYKGFRLFVVKKKQDKHWFASVTVGNKIEISIPLTVDPMWLAGFDTENNGY